MREYKQKGNELIFKECPFCGNMKWNFQVNVEKNVIHCWVCGEKGGISKLNFLLPSVFREHLGEDVPISLPITLVLEEGYVDVIGTPGEQYMRERGFQLFEFIDWGIKYSKKGKLIFPLYKDDKLIYYVEKELASGRWYYPQGVSKKDIVWARVQDRENNYVILVEGLMDAVKVFAYGWNVMVLLGTHVFDKDVEFIKQRNLKPVLCLDGDCKIEVYKKIQKRLPEFDYMRLPVDKDPDEVSFDEFRDLFKSRIKFALGSELEMRWNANSNT